jgi:uncharacterized protein
MDRRQEDQKVYRQGLDDVLIGNPDVCDITSFPAPSPMGEGEHNPLLRHGHMNRTKLLSTVLLLACIAFLVSCTGGSALRFKQLGAVTAKEDYLSAIASIEKNAKKLYGKTNILLYHIDIGMLYHYAGVYDSSNAHLLKANDIFYDLFTRSVSNEAASLMVNDNVRPYRSRPYELVLVHQTIALNYLAMGNVEDALVETRQVDLLMQELQRKNKEGHKYTTDGMFHYLASIAYDAAGKSDDAMISLFKAVEAFKKGPVPLPPEVKDYACCMLQKNNRAEDIKLLEKSSSGESPRDTQSGAGNTFEYHCNKKPDEIENGATEIILIGYAGLGPRLVENNWWGTYIKDGMLLLNYASANGETATMQMAAPMLPQEEYEKASKGEKTRSGTTFHVSFALPAVKSFPSQTAYFTVSGAGLAAPESSVVVNDLDAQAGKNLDDTHMATLLRTVVRVVIRTIAAQKAKEGMETKSPIANLLINVGTDILADQLERADTRSCFFVPKTIQIARVRVQPGTYTLNAAAHGTNGAVVGTKTFEQVSVKKGEKKFVFYCSFK